MNISIINKYINKPLGWDRYGSNKKYFTDDFLNLETLSHIIAESYSSEININKDGVMFLKEYYGLKNLAEILHKNGGVESDLMEIDSIYEWLETLEKESSQY